MSAAFEMADDNQRLFGDRIYLASFSTAHARDAGYHGWLRDPDVIRTLNIPRYLDAPVSDAEIETYCAQVMQSPSDLFFAIHWSEDDAFIGTIKAAKIDRYAGHADIGIMIGRKDLWGQGAATEAIALLCRFLFEELGLRRLTAGSMAINPGMVRVFEKLGFRQEGVFRQQDRISETEYCDHIHLGCLRDEFLPPKAGVQE